MPNVTTSLSMLVDKASKDTTLSMVVTADDSKSVSLSMAVEGGGTRTCSLSMVVGTEGVGQNVEASGNVLMRAWQLTQTSGTGLVSLDPGGHEVVNGDQVQSFRSLVASAKEDTGDPTGPWVINYLLRDLPAWEIGSGTLTENQPTSADTLSRDAIEASSDGGSAISLSTPVAGPFLIRSAYSRDLAPFATSIDLTNSDLNGENPTGAIIVLAGSQSSPGHPIYNSDRGCVQHVYYDGTNTISTMMACRGAISQTQARSSIKNTSPFNVYTNTGESISMTGTVAFIADGVRITLNTAGSPGYDGEWYAFLIHGVQVSVGMLVLPASGSVSATGLPGRPRAVLAQGQRSTATPATNIDTFNSVIVEETAGSGTLKQSCVSGLVDHASDPADCWHYSSSVNCASRWSLDGTAFHAWKCTSFNGDGFTVTENGGGSGTDVTRMMYMAFGGGLDVGLAQGLQVPTSTGTQNRTPFSFVPDAIFLNWGNAESLETDAVGDFDVGFGFASGPSDEACISKSQEHNEGSGVNRAANANNRIITMQQAFADQRAQANLTALTATGWNENWSLIDTELDNTYYHVLGLGPGTGGGGNQFKDVKSTASAASLQRRHVGEIRATLRATEDTNWLFLDGRTMSDTGNGGTIAGPQYEQLFEIIKNVDPNAGTELWASDTVTLPDWRGRVIVAPDNMGGTSANVITDAWADTLGDTGGAATHTITAAEMATHTHSVPKGTTGVQAASSPPDENTAGTAGGNSGSVGGGGAHNNLMASVAINYFVRY